MKFPQNKQSKFLIFLFLCLLLSVCLPACLSVCISVFLSVCLIVLSVCSSIRPFIPQSIRLSVRQTVFPFIHLSVLPSLCPTVCLSIHTSVCPSISLSICLSVGPYVCLPFVCRSVCPYMSIHQLFFHRLLCLSKTITLLYSLGDEKCWKSKFLNVFFSFSPLKTKTLSSISKGSSLGS
jgi:hypothetical protein